MINDNKLIAIIFIILLISIVTLILCKILTNKSKIQKKNGIYLSKVKVESFDGHNCMESVVLPFSGSRREQQFCNKINVNRVFLVYCEGLNMSPSEYSKSNGGDCPHRRVITLYNNGVYYDPKLLLDSNNNPIDIEKLKPDVGIDADLNGKNIRMDDIPFSEGRKSNCGRVYNLEIDASDHHPKCVFNVYIDEKYKFKPDKLKYLRKYTERGLKVISVEYIFESKTIDGIRDADLIPSDQSARNYIYSIIDKNPEILSGSTDIKLLDKYIEQLVGVDLKETTVKNFIRRWVESSDSSEFGSASDELKDITKLEK